MRKPGFKRRSSQALPSKSPKRGEPHRNVTGKNGTSRQHGRVHSRSGAPYPAEPPQALLEPLSASPLPQVPVKPTAATGNQGVTGAGPVQHLAMGETRWQPMSVRLGHAAPLSDGPFEGVPDHLLGPLRSWVDTTLDRGQEDLSFRIAMSLRLKVDGYLSAVDELMDVLYGETLLDVIDVVLFLAPQEISDPGFSTDIADLVVILETGGSAYRVASDQRGLERRIAETVTTAAATVAQVADGSAGEHLSLAWRNVYGRRPDPSKAYSEAIKAVEAAAIPVVLPTDAKATLGKIIGHLRGTAGAWQTAISCPADGSPIGPVVAMLELLWQGQTGRHSTAQGTVQETQESAEMAVHLATTLVQWFTGGSISPA